MHTCRSPLHSSRLLRHCPRRHKHLPSAVARLHTTLLLPRPHLAHLPIVTHRRPDLNLHPPSVASPHHVTLLLRPTHTALQLLHLTRRQLRHMHRGHQQRPTHKHPRRRSPPHLRLFHHRHKDHLVDPRRAHLELHLHLKPHLPRPPLPHQPPLNRCLRDPALRNLRDPPLQPPSIVSHFPRTYLNL